jgi:uncharacterized membrane protein (UPF0127 family)
VTQQLGTYERTAGGAAHRIAGGAATAANIPRVGEEIRASIAGYKKLDAISKTHPDPRVCQAAKLEKYRAFAGLPSYLIDAAQPAIRAEQAAKLRQTQKQSSMLKTVPFKLVTPEGKERAKFKAEMADTPDTRRTGLSKRGALQANTGMLFDIPGPFWMKDVKFALDIVYLDKQGTIIETGHMPAPPAGSERVPDWLMPRYRSTSGKTANALEMPGGWVSAHGAQPGDRVEIDTHAHSAVH